MKVILVGNFDKEDVSDELLAENLTEDEANSMANEYNAKCGEDAYYYARVVNDAHRLYHFDGY